jgi:HK97 family phage portal protein
MSLLGSLLRPLNGKAPIPLGDGVSAARRGLSYSLGNGRGDAETFMRQYGISGTIYGIISLLAESAATPTWKLYKKPPADGRVRYTTADKGSDQRVQVVQHAAIQLWNAPNDWHSGFEFREGSQQHQELTGETFWVMDTEAGFPTSMWYVRPDRMEPVPDPDDFLLGWIYRSPTGEQVPLRTEEVILEKRPDPLDPYRGAGPVASILPNIQQQRYATEYQRNLFLNGADPGGVITVPNRLSEPQFDELVDRWRESHRGVARAGQVGVLENGATWSANAHSNKDMEYGQLRLANRDELREAWRIHKAMMGTSDDVNRANAQTAQEVFVAWQVLPRLNRRRDTLNSKFLPLFGGSNKTVEFDYDDPSPVNAETAANELLQKAQAAQALLTPGVFNPRDVLEAVGLPDMDLADIPAAVAPPAPPPDVGPPPNASELGDQGQNRARPSITMRRPAFAAPTAPPHDLDDVDKQWKKAVAILTAAYLLNIIPAQRKQLRAQITTLVDAGKLALLAELNVDSTAGANLLLTSMTAMAAAAAKQAAAEAAKQGAAGVTAQTVSRDALAEVADLTASLQSAQLALSAGSEATRLALAAGDSADGTDVARQVDAFLSDLSDASLTGRLAGALSAAQNEARIATFVKGPSADLFASEVNDKSTCSPCKAIDSTYIGNTADENITDAVDALYPNGGYIGCAGGSNCRGTVIADYTNDHGGTSQGSDLGLSDRHWSAIHTGRTAPTAEPDTAELAHLLRRVLSDGYMPVQTAGRH